MNVLLQVTFVFVVLYAAVVALLCTSELTYRRRTIADLRMNFKSLLLRSLVLVGALVFATGIYRALGWH